MCVLSVDYELVLSDHAVRGGIMHGSRCPGAHENSDTAVTRDRIPGGSDDPDLIRGFAKIALQFAHLQHSESVCTHSLEILY